MKVWSKVAVVIPAFNEKATLRWVVQGVLAHASLVIVVDDGSTDGTADVVADLPVILLRNERNEGKAASLWRGAHEALRHQVACGIDVRQRLPVIGIGRRGFGMPGPARNYSVFPAIQTG